jgi:hypothetical protein
VGAEARDGGDVGWRIGGGGGGGERRQGLQRCRSGDEDVGVGEERETFVCLCGRGWVGQGGDGGDGAWDGKRLRRMLARGRRR